jgi:hypothetical protein
MQSAEKAMRAELKQHTLADLVQRTVDKAPASFGLQVVQWLTDRAANRRGDKEEVAPAKTRKRG